MSIRQKLGKEGFSDGVYNLIVGRYKNQSDKRSTLFGHQKVWGEFVRFCGNSARALDFRVTDIANFLSDLFNKGARGTRISAAISTLELTRGFFIPNGTRLAENPIIESLRRSAKVQRPPLKDLKSDQYYDPYLILRSVSKRRNKSLSCVDLRAKAVTLVCIDGAMRVNELAKMYLENFTFELKEVTVRVCFTKEKQQNAWTGFRFFCSCVSGLKPELSWRQEACTYCTLKAYAERKRVVARREKVVKCSYTAPEGDKLGTPFFVTHKNKAKGLSVNSIRSDVLKVMAGAGLEDSWNPHSLRGAVTSKLFNLGIDEKRVLQFGRWSNVKTFRENCYRQRGIGRAEQRASVERHPNACYDG